MDVYKKALLLSFCLFMSINVSGAMAGKKEDNMIRPKFNRQMSVYYSEVSEINSKLERFVKYFVEAFEHKLLEYSYQLSGEIRKSGKYAEIAKIIGKQGGGALGGMLAYVAGAPPAAGSAAAGGGIGWIVSKIADKIGEGDHMEKVTSLSHLVNFVRGSGTDEDASEKAAASFRKMLVEAGVDIFQSFEFQFMYVVSEKDLRNLALDAVDRAIYYMKDKKEFDKTLITKGVILAKSKDRFRSLAGCIKKGKPLIYGFEVEYEYGNKSSTWDTSKLYSKTGIAIPAGEKDAGYYKKIKDESIESDGPSSGDLSADEEEDLAVDGLPNESDCTSDDEMEELESDGIISSETNLSNTDRYGYRRLLTSENWDELRKDYQDDIITTKSKQEFVGYEYVLDPKEIEEISEAILKKINFDDKGLMEKRITVKLKEIEGKIEDLKTIIVNNHKEYKQSQINSAQIEDALREENLTKIIQYFEGIKQEFIEVTNKNYRGIQEQMAKIEKALSELYDNTKD